MERLRCTVCVEEEPVFGTGEPYCLREEEDYRSPSAKCEQFPWNTRPRLSARAQLLTNEQLTVETNEHYSGVNTSIMHFIVGDIPSEGQLFAPFVESASHRSTAVSTAVLVLAALLPQRGGALGALLALAVGADAKTKILHLHENECKCIGGCGLFQGSYGDCTDQGDHNAKLFSRAVDRLPDNEAKICELLQCLSFCNGPWGGSKGRVNIADTPTQALCAGIAKEIGCNVDCGAAVRHGLSRLLALAAVAVATWRLV